MRALLPDNVLKALISVLIFKPTQELKMVIYQGVNPGVFLGPSWILHGHPGNQTLAVTKSAHSAIRLASAGCPPNTPRWEGRARGLGQGKSGP